MTATQLLRRLLIVLMLLISTIPSTNARAQTSIQGALQPLATIDVFAFGGVGIAGRTSMGELNFRAIMAEPPERALALFEKLYATGNLQGKCYALAGIRALNPTRFKELYDSVLSSKESVKTMHGCIISSESFSSIARQIDTGDYDAWMKPKPSPSKKS